jgi:hypothetical protein
MKLSKINRKDIFQDQLKNFKALLIGSKMAGVSAMLLALFSLIAAIICRGNLEQAIPLLLGAVAQIVYAIKYLQLTDIKQKSYTQTSLESSISKFKVYMTNRKRYETLVMAFYALTLIPFALGYESLALVLSICLIGILLVSFLGMLAFKRVDSNIVLLEATLKNGML